jgi:hypothetical protein
MTVRSHEVTPAIAGSDSRFIFYICTKYYFIYTCHSRFTAEGVKGEGVKELSQLFLRDILRKCLSPSDRSPSGVSAVNPFLAFYDIHGRKREELEGPAVSALGVGSRKLSNVLKVQS